MTSLATILHELPASIGLRQFAKLQHRILDILLRRQDPEQVEALEHEPDRSCPHVGKLIGGLAGYLLAVDSNPAGIGRAYTPEDAQQGRLATSPDGPAIARNTPASIASETSCKATTSCSPRR